MTTIHYAPPKIDLKTAVEEYEIEFTKDNCSTLYQLINILESGVDKVSLKINDSGIIEATGNFKSIHCNNVKIKSISDKGICESKTDAKFRIETAFWSFPCPDYKYSNIKRNLERAICEILHIQNCEIKSFLTEIVEYDSNEK